MVNPLVSIILPTYNGSKFLATSLQSCIDQTYQNLEIIVIDDCSTDNTSEIALDFGKKDVRVKLIRNQVNKKLPLSLNAGFENATGIYFTWTSDDNYYALNAIEEMVRAISEQDAGLVYSNYTLIDDAGNVTGTKTFNDINESVVKWEGCGACFLYKAELHTTLKGYDASAFLIEDYDFFLRAFLKTKFYYLNRTDLYFYREHAGSLTSLYGFYNKDLQKIVIERQLQQLTPSISQNDQALLYRKFAVYYALYKNNADRSGFYLRSLANISKSKTLVTAVYIIAYKCWLTVKIGIHTMINLFKALFKA